MGPPLSGSYIRNTTDICNVIKAEEKIKAESFTKSLRIHGSCQGQCLNVITEGFLNCLVLVRLLEQRVSWEVLPGEAVQPEDGKGVRWIHGQQVCKQLLRAAGRDLPWYGAQRIRSSTPAWSGVSPCSAGDRPGGSVPQVPSCQEMSQWVPWGDISVPVLGSTTRLVLRGLQRLWYCWKQVCLDGCKLHRTKIIWAGERWMDSLN